MKPYTSWRAERETSPSGELLEFGHSVNFIAKGRTDCWGTGPFSIEAGGARFRFIDSDRFGPHIADKHGDPVANPWPPERSPFWIAHRAWRRGGMRLADDGATCIYDVPRPSKVRRIGKRSVVIVEAGDEDGGMVEVE